MVQRKVASKLGIQADHVKSDKHSANLKLSSSQHQDGKNRGADMKKKMKKSRSIKLSDLEALQTSSPSRKSLPQLEKSPPPHVSTTSASASPQKQQHMVRAIDCSPNYMKPTSSSHAKKELFLVSLRNTQSGCSDIKKRKFSSDSKASCDVSSNKKAANALSRSSSLSKVRTLTKKTTSFKATSRSCPRKPTRASSSMCAADISTPKRATCSSTLKDSKFPSYLMLNHGGTESEGTSVMKVCPYTYCSLNGHHHVALPPLKNFVSQRRRLLKTQKSMKLMDLEVISPRRLKVPCETEEGSDVEQNLFNGKLAYDEIGMDICIEIYAKDNEETGAEEVGKIDFHKGIVIQEDIKSSIEDHAKHVSPTVPDTLPKFEIDLEENFKNSFDDVANEVDAKGSFFQEQNAGDSDLNDQACWFHEEISMGSYCSDKASYDVEDIEDVEMNGSNCKDMEWDEKFFPEFEDEEGADFSVFTEEDTDSKAESLSESSKDVSVLWLDDILSSYCENILDGEELQEANAEDNGGDYEKRVDYEETICEANVLDEEKTGNGQYPKMSESCKSDETGEDRCSSLENKDNRIDEGIGGEEKNSTENWKGANKNKRPIEVDDETKNFNPREPNFLPLVPEPDPEKVDLKHQMMDERKSADDWMIDCALRQVVTKLAPARKKKVALLVEAFETVMPIPKYDTRMRNNSAFAHARHIQACS